MRRFPTFAPQYLLRSSLDVYERWTAARKLPRTIDALPNDVKLLWIGPKRLDNVILFIHGEPSPTLGCHGLSMCSIG